MSSSYSSRCSGKLVLSFLVLQAVGVLAGPGRAQFSMQSFSRDDGTSVAREMIFLDEQGLLRWRRYERGRRELAALPLGLVSQRTVLSLRAAELFVVSGRSGAGEASIALVRAQTSATAPPSLEILARRYLGGRRLGTFSWDPTHSRLCVVDALSASVIAFPISLDGPQPRIGEEERLFGSELAPELLRDPRELEHLVLVAEPQDPGRISLRHASLRGAATHHYERDSGPWRRIDLRPENAPRIESQARWHLEQIDSSSAQVYGPRAPFRIVDLVRREVIAEGQGDGTSMIRVPLARAAEFGTHYRVEGANAAGSEARAARLHLPAASARTGIQLVGTRIRLVPPTIATSSWTYLVSAELRAGAGALPGEELQLALLVALRPEPSELLLEPAALSGGRMLVPDFVRSQRLEGSRADRRFGLTATLPRGSSFAGATIAFQIVVLDAELQPIACSDIYCERVR